MSVTIKAYHPIPRSAPKYKREAMLSGELVPLTKPDADNVLKLVLDALNGLAYLDDKQVTRLRYRATPWSPPSISGWRRRRHDPL